MEAEQLAEKVRRVQLQTDRLVSSGLSGAYLSVFKGRGIEFDEARPYVPGDDVRDIDWNVTARTGEPYIKRYVEERELAVMLVVDTSLSLAFGSQDRSKAEAAAEFAALIAFAAIHNGDKIGLLLYRENDELYIPPRKGQKHALRIVRELLLPTDTRSVTPSLPTRIKRLFSKLSQKRRLAPRDQITPAIEFCRGVLRRRAVIFVLSDFLDVDPFAPLRSAKRKHDVIGVLVEDERERTMPNGGLVTLLDAETAEPTVIDAGSKAFNRALSRTYEERIDSLTTSMQRSKIDLVRVDATQPVIEPLLGFLRRRERRKGR